MADTGLLRTLPAHISTLSHQRYPLELRLVVAAGHGTNHGDFSVPVHGNSLQISTYSGYYANYDATYGSLGAGIGLMMWMWVSSIVILFGAQLNSEIEHQTAKDSTVEHDRPLGARGVVMAETVGKTA